MTSARLRGLLAGAIAAAVAVRLVFALFPAETSIQTKVVAALPDAVEYQQLGRNIATQGVFARFPAGPAEIFRTPGYPLLLAIIYRLPADPIVMMLLVQGAISVGLVLLTAALGREAGLRPRQQAAAGLVVATSPTLAFLATKMVTETTFTLLLAVSVLLLLRFRRTADLGCLIGASVAAGLMILVRPIAVAFPFLVAAGVVTCGVLATRRRLAYALLAVACSALVVVPWIVRNKIASGRAVVSTAGERNLFLYNAATVLASDWGTTLESARDSMRAEASAELGPLDTTDEAGFWQRLSRVAARHLLRHPMRTLAVQAAGGVACLLSPIPLAPLLVHAGAQPAQSSPHLFQRSLATLARGQLAAAWRTAWTERLAALGGFCLVVSAVAAVFTLGLVTLAGLGALRTRPTGWGLLLVTVGYFVLLPGPVGDSRFRAPVEPLMAVLAASAISRKTGSRLEPPS